MIAIELEEIVKEAHFVMERIIDILFPVSIIPVQEI